MAVRKEGRVQNQVEQVLVPAQPPSSYITPGKVVSLSFPICKMWETTGPA